MLKLGFSELIQGQSLKKKDQFGVRFSVDNLNIAHNPRSISD